MTDMKLPKEVRVEWLDARSVYEQIELGHVAAKCQLYRRFTAGFLVYKDRERVIIAGTFDPAEKKIEMEQTPDEDGGADFTVIPRGWIKGITLLTAVALGTGETEEA